MKKLLFLFALTLSTMSIIFISSCKKDEAEEIPEINAEAKQHTQDENLYKSESDDADQIVNDVVSGSSMGRSKKVQVNINSICGVDSIDSTGISSSPKTLILYFDGTTNCWGRVRSGKIKVELTAGTNWSQQGAELTFTFIDYKIKRGGRSITFNGTKVLTNLNGNNWYSLYLGGGTFKYRERATNINVAFESGLTAIWNSTRTTEWSFVQTGGLFVGYYTVVALGDTTMNGHSYVDNWGTNRYGKPFLTYYNNALESNTNGCELYKWRKGELVHTVDGTNFYILAGVDANGNNMSACPYGFKVTWIDARSNMRHVVIPY